MTLTKMTKLTKIGSILNKKNLGLNWTNSMKIGTKLVYTYAFIFKDNNFFNQISQEIIPIRLERAAWKEL